MIVREGWGTVHGVFYEDGSVRDPSIAAAIMGFFRKRTKDILPAIPDKEFLVTKVIGQSDAWLKNTKGTWNEGLDIAETSANLLEAGELTAMRIPPTQEVEMLRQGKENQNALKALIIKFKTQLEPYKLPNGKKIKLKILFLLFVLTSGLSFSQVRLPKLVSEGMVLQRDANIRIWGWASNNEKVTICFLDASYNTTANTKGEWEVMLPKLKVGGPYKMQIDANNSITINDILIGDVWVCSGQSNMQSSLRFLPNYQDEIAQSENTNIRQFMVEPGFKLGDKETDYHSGSWQSANPKNVLNFSAVGYFFAKKLYDTYKVPIGLINASVGGSSAEAWISEESIKEFPKYYEDVQRFKTPGYLERINKQDDEHAKTWNNQLRQNDEAYKDTHKKWSDPQLNTSNWETMHVPGYWADTKLGNINGVVWYRREIDIPADMAGKPGIIKLGRIVDADSVFMNGQFIGSIGFQYAPRAYKIPENLLKPGENTVVVRITNYIHHGGFVPGKPYEISTNDKTIGLEGDWKYRIGSMAEPLDDRLFTGKIPTGLFNSMLAPMLNYTIKGAIWYQGESNTSRAHEHFDLFKLLIKDWRINWNQGGFPFLYVQLPNFIEVNVETTKYDWALFRESQLKALVIPNTGMAVTIDIGEFNDIHPIQKKPVGERLALAAQKHAYGDNKVVFSGPIYKSMEIKGNQVTLLFTNIGNGLMSKNNEELKCFEICGIDNIFYPAKAKIVKDKIVVVGEKVGNPVAVRYAWANNPEKPNLYNKEGLPASPFRTSELY
jgi:sialate O-acetylesterase